MLIIGSGLVMLAAGVAFALTGSGGETHAPASDQLATESQASAKLQSEPEPTVTPTSTAIPEPTPDARAGQIRAMLAGRPLAEYAEEMLATSDRYGIDWRYLPVLSFLESGGGVAACGGNAWGYAACDVRFPDYLTGMDTVAATLARYPYAGESIATVLCIWQSGGGCTTGPAIAYAHLAAPYFARLGPAIGLPAQLASQPAPPTATPPAPVPTETPVTGTPAASPTPAPATPVPPTPAATSAPTGDSDAGAGGAGIAESPVAGAG